MRRARESAPKVHPHASWLGQQLAPPQAGTRTLVLAPSAEAAAALRAATLEVVPALLGVRFVAAVAFLREVLFACGEPADEDLLPALGERALLRRVLRRASGDVAAYALRHRASFAALHATCREWARAGRPLADGLAAWATQTLHIAREFTAALADDPRPSRIQLAERATRALGAGARPRLRVLVMPGPLPGDVRAVLANLTEAGVAVTPAPPGAATAPRLGRSAHPHLEAELRAAAHRCALAFHRGTPLSAMVVAAPRLAPYLPYLASAFAAEGLPLRAQAETPLTAEPRGALAVHALRLLFDGAPARAYLALLGSPLARQPLDGAQLGALERAAREHGLAGCDVLAERVAAALAATAPHAAAGLRRLAALSVNAAALAGAPARAQALADLLAAELAPPAPGSRDADAHARLTRVVAELIEADDQAFVADALDALAAGGLAIGAGGGAAVHAVEFASALAFPATRVELVGFADDQLPAPAPTPTFLDESARAILGMEGRVEARAAELALASALGQLPAADLHVSRPLTDAQGRPVGPSPLLSAVLTAPDAPAEQVESSHPAARAAARIAAGSAAPDFTSAHVALHPASPAATARLLGGHAAALRLRVQAFEEFAGDLAREGDIGPERTAARADAPMSVSELQTLARCALQHFFRRLLGVRALPPEPDALALAPNALGNVVHEILADRHTQLAAAAAAGTDVDADALAAELLPELDRQFAARAPLAHTLPALHRILVRQWARAIAVAIADDVRDLRTRQIRPLHREHEITGEIDVGLPRTLRVRGVADRIDAMHGGALRVIDYKTGRNPNVTLRPLDILRGRQLQMPIYALLTQQMFGAPTAELGVRAVRPDRSAPDELWLRWNQAGDFLGGRFSSEFFDTLRRLVAVRDAGAFVPSLDRDNACRFCDFRAACHRLHPPSRERVTNSGRAEVDAYLGVRNKRLPRRGDDAP